MDIKITRTTTPFKKPDEKNLGFAKYKSDHMFLMDYSEEEGWHNPRIIPYAPIEMDPAAVVFHYAQETFEGLKAYRANDDRILLFRPEMNARRLQNSNRRLCIPEIPEDVFVEAVQALVAVDADWVPHEPETSLYIRPFVVTTDCQIGLHPSHKFQFVIITFPVAAYYPEGLKLCSATGSGRTLKVAAYYPEGLKPVDIMVEEEFVRAVRGGTGFAKCGGNYAASMIAQEKAEKRGYSQVLWLDGVKRKYVEEMGGMNIMFKISGEIYTAPLEGTVLPGITRDSVLTILRDWGIKTHEEWFTIDQIMQAGHDGTLEEVFATGTAAVISPVGLLDYRGDKITINNKEIGPLTKKLYQTLTGIQWGREPDPYGWVRSVRL
ncbi:MAG: Branched-chain-amino-acid aminotransferase [Oscillospiraceae bacterium]|jgi:branched-chain amino acid aminotransferase